MESKYYLRKKSNRLVRVSSRESGNYFMDYVHPPFHGKMIERAAFDFLVKLGNFIPVNEATARVLYDK